MTANSDAPQVRPTVRRNAAALEMSSPPGKAVRQYKNRVIVHAGASYNDARREVVLWPSPAPPPRPLWRSFRSVSSDIQSSLSCAPARGRCGVHSASLDLTGLEGVSGWDWNGVFDTLAALAASLMVEGVVALTLIGLLLLLLLDLFGLIGFVPNWVVDTVDTSVSSRCHSARAVGFAIAVFLV